MEGDLIEMLDPDEVSAVSNALQSINSGFTCSPFQISWLNPGSQSSLCSPNAGVSGLKISENLCPSLVSDNVNKENMNLNKAEAARLSVERQQMKRKKKGSGYNLRKSLAWDRAFFTEEGVLDSVELSILTGNSGQSGGEMLSTIQEEGRESMSGLDSSSDSSYLQAIKENLFKELPATTEKEAKKAVGTKQKNETLSSNCAPVPKRRVLSPHDTRSGSKRSGRPGLLVTSAQKRPANAHTIKTERKGPRAPKLPVTKPAPPVIANTIKRPIPSSSKSKENQPTQSVINAQKRSNGLRGFSNNNRSTQGGAKSDMLGKSSVPKLSDQQAQRKMGKTATCVANRPSTNVNDTPKTDINLVLPTHPSGPHGCGSEPMDVVTSAPQDACHSNLIKKRADFQTAKPSGLRMPTPSLGFFGQSKCSAPQGPSQVHSSNLPYPFNHRPPRPPSFQTPKAVRTLTSIGNTGVSGSRTKSSTPSAVCHSQARARLDLNSTFKLEVEMPHKANRDGFSDSQQQVHASQAEKAFLHREQKEQDGKNDDSLKNDSASAGFNHDNAPKTAEVVSTANLVVQGKPTTITNGHNAHDEPSIENFGMPSDQNDGMHDYSETYVDSSTSVKDKCQEQYEKINSQQCKDEIDVPGEPKISLVVGENPSSSGVSQQSDSSFHTEVEEKAECITSVFHNLDRKEAENSTLYLPAPEMQFGSGYELQNNIEHKAVCDGQCNSSVDNQITDDAELDIDDSCSDQIFSNKKARLIDSCFSQMEQKAVGESQSPGASHTTFSVEKLYPIGSGQLDHKFTTTCCPRFECHPHPRVHSPTEQTEQKDEVDSRLPSLDGSSGANGELSTVAFPSQGEEIEENSKPKNISLVTKNVSQERKSLPALGLCSAPPSPKAGNGSVNQVENVVYAPKHESETVTSEIKLSVERFETLESVEKLENPVEVELRDKVALSAGATVGVVSCAVIEKEAPKSPQNSNNMPGDLTLSPKEVTLTNNSDDLPGMMEASVSKNTDEPKESSCDMDTSKPTDASNIHRKSQIHGKSDALVVKPPPYVVPFSDEWLAAIEAAGEEILTLKTGAVQHSPPDKPVPEPSPWSPVKRKNPQGIGPFDCTKYTNTGTSGCD